MTTPSEELVFDTTRAESVTRACTRLCAAVGTVYHTELQGNLPDGARPDPNGRYAKVFHQALVTCTHNCYSNEIKKDSKPPASDGFSLGVGIGMLGTIFIGLSTLASVVRHS